MKTMIKSLALLIILSTSFQTSSAQSVQQSVQEALAVWQVLNNNVQLSTLKEQNENGQTVAKGKVTAFGQNTTLSATLGSNKKVKQIALDFPEMTQINVQHIRSIAGKSIQDIVPAELGAAIRYDRLEVDLDGRDITAATLYMSAGTWAPFKGQDLKLSSLILKLSILNPLDARALDLGMEGSLFLPREIANYINIGATSLTIKGAINTGTGDMSVGTELASEGIPIHPDKVLLLRNARMEFYLEDMVPGLALGGQLEIRPPNQNDPILLDGELSIDLTGEIYGQGYMTGAWENPLNLAKDLYITQMGGGFGMDFKAAGFPLPIIAFEGGFNIGSADPNRARFGGQMTVAFHPTDPSRNMIDAQIHKATLNDVVAAFYPNGVPKEMTAIFKQIHLRNARMTIVPPGDESIEVFGKKYEPGIHLQGHCDVGDFTSSVLISIKEDELLAYYGLTEPIKLQGFTFASSSNPRSGPEAFIQLSKAQGKFPPVEGFFGIDGKVKILDLNADADIYLSDAGFNCTVSGQIKGGFRASLDIAGTDLLKKNGGVYVKATLQNDMTQKINEVAANHIKKLTNDVNSEFDKAQAFVDRNKGRLPGLKRDYETARQKVKKEFDDNCKKYNSLKQQKKTREAEKTRINNDIKKLQDEKRSLDGKIAKGYAKAKFNRKTSVTGCPSGSTYDAINGGGCWSCPSGYRRDHLVAINNRRACVKAGGKDYRKANYHGKSIKKSTLLGPVETFKCNKGFYDAINGGTCWSIPSGYARDHTRPINHPKVAVRTLPEKRTAGVKKQDRSCRDGFVVPRNGGECWSCPSGFIRPTASTIDVTSSKACEKRDVGKWISRRDWLVAEIKTKKLLNNKVLKAVSDISREMTRFSKNVCKLSGDIALVDADPRVAPKKRAYESLRDEININQTIIDAGRGLSVGGLKAAEWIVRNGGQALGVVDIKQASFSGCANVVNGGRVALKVKGTFADQPLDASFDINLASPEQGIRLFADMLMGTNSARALKSNGTCTRPTVPRPDLSDSKIAEFKQQAKNNPNINPDKVSTKDRPNWAGSSRFKDGKPVFTHSGPTVSTSNRSPRDNSSNMGSGSNNNNNTSSSSGSWSSNNNPPNSGGTNSTNHSNTPIASSSSNSNSPNFQAGEKAYEEGLEKLKASLFEEADILFNKAARLGHPGGYNGLGVMARNGLLSGSAENKKSFEYFQKGYQMGFHKSAFNVGVAYLYGLGAPVDFNKAIKAYQYASDQGFVPAERTLKQLGVIHQQASSAEIANWINTGNGEFNKKNYKAAFDLYQKAAAAGNKDARFALGVMYWNGQGVKSDYKAAYYYYTQAAIQGHPTAQYYAAGLAKNGHGTKQNNKVAIYWLEQAVNNGVSEAQQHLDELRRRP